MPQCFGSKTIKFIGSIKEFISAAAVTDKGGDYSKRIVSVMAQSDGTELSAVGVVKLNDLGIVEILD